MTHRSMKNRLLGSMLASVMVPSLALGAAALHPALAHAEVNKAKCKYSAVFLAKEGDGKIPAELEFLRPQLESDEFAVYKYYQLVDEKTLKLKLETPSEATFKTGHKLKLTLRGGDDKKLKLHADLSSRDGTKSLVGTEYSIEDDALLMFRVGKYTEGERTGTLVFVGQCNRKT